MNAPPFSSNETTAVVLKLNEEQLYDVKVQKKEEKKFDLSPKYDENYSQWTLKYRVPAPGLVELLENSSVYVNAGQLAECKTLSNDWHRFTEMLLFEVFTLYALSTCTLPAALCDAYGTSDYRIDKDDVPELNLHGTETFLKFIAEYGLERDWNVKNYGCILKKIHKITRDTKKRWPEANKKHDGKRKFVLPPEYNAKDSRWTLKYRKSARGLVKLMNSFPLYVNAEKLAECKTLSNDWHKFTEMLLFEVFTKNALSACTLPAVLCEAFDTIEKDDIPKDKPELDLQGTKIFLMFIAEYGLEEGWNVGNDACILKKVHEIMVEAKERWSEANEKLDRRRKFVLPPEYNVDNSRWTLKYHKSGKRLVKLTKRFPLYVNAVKFAECKTLSKDCVTLVRRLVNEIFTTNALSACSVTNIASNVDSNITNLRPVLDAKAMKILLKFIAEYALENEWQIMDYRFILNCIQQKIEVMRYVKLNEKKVERTRNAECNLKWPMGDSICTLLHRIPSWKEDELIENSGVYVNRDNLNECKKLSNDCATLAVRLLTEVYKMSALQEFSLSENNRSIYEPLSVPNTHPHNQQESCELDAHAEIILLHFVDEYGLKMGWPLLDFRIIRKSMLQKIQEIQSDHFYFLKNQTDRWTLLFRGLAPGLVELIEHSCVYVDADKLDRYRNSDNIEAMVFRLLYEVFTVYALGTCTIPAALCNDDCLRVDPNRPELDLHATTTILDFVEECRKKQGRKVLDKRYVVALIYCGLEKERKKNV